uniref:Uncharacterized protein n=1 Tax=Tanacetum cinerariifolium TaxID=118510 RepID=A0A6L2NLB9_TANCI|nr:hypothetical protein [Tanacetum cinerariifolium]
MDVNKKVDLENPLCLDKSRILANILQNHPLRFSIAASSSLPWIYLGQFWHTLFTKLIVSHYMTIFLEISRRARDRYHNLEDDVMIKSIFSLGKSKNVVGMKIPDWFITEEMKLMENYWLYPEVFGVDVPITQPWPIESTQGTHRITSAPRTPNPKIAEGESSAPRREKRRKELKAKQNVEKVKENLMAKEIEKLVEGSENVEENVEVASSPLRNDDNQTNLDTRLEPRSDKESPEVEKIAKISQPVNVIKVEEE